MQIMTCKYSGCLLHRQQELETRLKLSSILGESQTTIVAAAENKEELERLAKRLRSAEDDAARLRGVLRDQVRASAQIISSLPVLASTAA
jgi:Flp pilus assembly protein TadB